MRVPLPEGASNLAGATITSIRPVDKKGGFMVKLFCRYSHDGYTCSFYLNEKRQTASITEHLTRMEEYVRTACWKGSFYRLEEETLENPHGCGDGKVRVSLMHWNTRYVLAAAIASEHSVRCQRYACVCAFSAKPSPPPPNRRQVV